MSTNGTAMEPMIRPHATPGRIGQATAIEQSRAIAQVQAMVIVAQQCPRSKTAAIAAMEEACSQVELAEQAFFRYERGKLPNGKPNVITGPSVHLARELARCWGNIEHGVTELRRDDLASESEMQAFAWDLQTNTRSASIFIVPHKRDTRNGVKDLTDMRDIYENNANNGARRLREAIYSVLPVWYRKQAEALSRKTMEEGGGRPIAQRITEAVKAFERYRVSPARLAAKFGHESVDDLTAADVADLGVIYDSLKQGTVTVDDEFPAEAARIAAGDLATTDASPAGKPHLTPGAAESAAPPAEPAGEAPERPPAKATTGQVSAIRRKMRELGYGDEPDEKAARLRATARLAKRKGELATTRELTQPEAALVRQRIDSLPDPAALHALLDDLREAEAQDAAGEPDGE